MVWWAALLTGALVLWNLPVTWGHRLRAGLRETLAPIQEMVSATGLRIREAVDVVRGYGGHVEENRRLAEEIVHLRRRVRELAALEEENEALRRLLGFRQTSEQRLLAARVIARDAALWWQMARIDRGWRDDVRVGFVVITPDGLVGQVVECTPRTADVLLISDGNCRVAVRLPRANLHGVLVGQGAMLNGAVRCRVDFIHRHADIRPGDEVITSGLGGVYPAGIPVGYIERVYPDERGLYQSADVIPHADLGRLRYVFVLSGDMAD